MDKYTIEYIRARLHHIIDKIDNKGFLYQLWTQAERIRIRETKAA